MVYSNYKDQNDHDKERPNNRNHHEDLKTNEPSSKDEKDKSTLDKFSLKEDMINKWKDDVEKNPTSLTNRNAILHLLSISGLDQYALYEKFDDVIACLVNKLGSMIDYSNKKFDPSSEILNFLQNKFANIYSNLQYYNETKNQIVVKDNKPSPTQTKEKSLSSKFDEHYVKVKTESSLNKEEFNDDQDLKVDNGLVFDINGKSEEEGPDGI